VKFYLIILASVFLVLSITAGGRVFISWLASALKPFIGIIMFLFSAHFTVAKHLITSRSIIYPSLAKKTVHRSE